MPANPALADLPPQVYRVERTEPAERAPRVPRRLRVLGHLRRHTRTLADEREITPTDAELTAIAELFALTVE